MAGLTEDEKARFRGSLVVDRKAILGAVVDRARELIVLDEHGTPYIRAPRAKLSDGQSAALLLLGRFLANALDLGPKDSMATDELARSTGILPKPLTARMSELRKKGWIESSVRGEYRIVQGAVEEILADVERSLRGGVR